MSTTNDVYYNISRDGSEAVESPVIPMPQGQNHARTQRPHQASGLRLEADLRKSRVPGRTGSSPMVPQPLSLANRAVGTDTRQAAAPAKLITTTATATANQRPVSPSPSLFPIPPSSNAILASPLTVSPLSIHRSNSLSRSSVYSQNTVSNLTTSTRAPRPTSSIYSQNTMGNVAGAVRPPPGAVSSYQPNVAAMMPVAESSSPRTPTMTNWESVLPGLPNLEPFPALTETALLYPQPQATQPSNQHIQVQIQVPRLRSPSLPQDRGSRRATLSNGAGTQVIARNAVAAAATAVLPDNQGQDWPLQKPSMAHSAPEKRKHYVHRSRGSGSGLGSPPEPHLKHTANKPSVSSSFTHVEPQDQCVASPRASADSHTPMTGPGEQRSGWWSDDEDEEQGRAGRPSYGAVEMKEKQGTEVRRRRARQIKIIVGVSVLVVIIIVGVAVGVALGIGKQAR